jgi:Spy/CpxP family protein refolding chaperone
MKVLYTSVAAAVLLLSVAVASAQPPGPPVPGHGAEKLASYLQLTPDQIASWQQIHKDTAAAIKPLALNARGLREQIDAAVNSASPDPASLGSLALSLHTVQSQIKAVREQSRTRLLAVLSADQKTKFEAFEAAAAFLKTRRTPARGN